MVTGCPSMGAPTMQESCSLLTECASMCIVVSGARSQSLVKAMQRPLKLHLRRQFWHHMDFCSSTNCIPVLYSNKIT